MLRFLSKAAFCLSGKEQFLSNRDKQICRTSGLCLAARASQSPAGCSALGSCPHGGDTHPPPLARAGQGWQCHCPQNHRPQTTSPSFQVFPALHHLQPQQRDRGVNKVGGPVHHSDWRWAAVCCSVPSRALLSHYLDIKDNRGLSFSRGETFHSLLNLKAPSSKRLHNIVMGNGAATYLGSFVTPCCIQWRGGST